MADPICRWRYLSRDTIRELVSLLPKQEMSDADFDQHMKKSCAASSISYEQFKGTAYQLAVQAGLYYVDDDNVFHPRFDHDLTAGEADNYLRVVSRCYTAPNPYTRSLTLGKAPISIFDYITARAKVPHLASPSPIDIKAELETYFGESLGKVDVLIAMLQNAGCYKKIDSNSVSYEFNSPTATDKAAFFNSFGAVDNVQGIETAKADNANLRDAFKAWMAHVERLTDSTIRNYLDALDRVSEEVPTPPAVMQTSGWWAGIYSYLTESPPPKKNFFEIKNIEELKKYFGAFDLLFADDNQYGSLNHNRYDECKKWAIGNGAKQNRRNIKYGYLAYKSFLVWRSEWKQHETPLSAVDLLSTALKMFTEKRKEEEWCCDNTDGDTSKPRMGYVVNAMRRGVSVAAPVATQLQHGTAVQIRAWFKQAIDPDSLKSVVDSVEDGDLVSFGPYIAVLIQPSTPPPARPSKFTRLLESVARNMIAPDKFGVYDENAHKALSFLGLISFGYNVDFSDIDYEDALHAQRVILRRLREMKLPQVQEFGKAYNPSDPDWKAADYLTVNEFLWFVNEYNDTISRECEAKMIKKADYSQASSKPAGKKPKVDFGNAEDVVLLRLAAALRAKPFAILAGHSGTGKSRMVRKLAYMTCANGGYKALLEGADGKPAATPGNFCMVQVKPNWHDSTDLLGYYSEIGSAFRSTDFVKFICKAYAYPDVPFFVCLDEMNLAPVEQYFAEYLSAIESRKVKDAAEFLDGDGNAKTGPKVITDTLLDKSVWKSASDLGCEFTQSAYWVEKHGLTIPRNLFVVGTVNMDESTNQFSRKVLDRAFTLEMTDADFEHFGEQSPEPSYEDYAGDDFVKELFAGKLFASDLTADHKLKPTQVNNLNKLKPILADSSFVVAYRFANEYALYEDALEKMLPQFDSSGGAGGASAGTSTGAAEAPATDGTTQPATGADGTTQPAAADGTQQPVAGGAGDSQGTASPSAKPEAFDDMILMKLLPRITGDAELVLKIFTGKENAQLDDADVKGLAGLLEKKGASFKKMKEIVKRGGTSLTFWP